MLPIRDTIRSYHFPVVNLVLIGINAVVFLFEISLPAASLDRLILNFGLTPARLHPLLTLAQPSVLVTMFTHMFLHGGWMHFLSNMWVLYIFGDNIEDRMGSGRYLAFYLAGGLASGLMQALVDPSSTVPAIGASGAIAAVLGAYFVLFPGARVVTLIPIFILPWFVEIPALFYLGFWFVSQIYSGISAVAGVAWWAHIGGFLFGALLHRLFTPPVHPAYTRWAARPPDELEHWR
jgi:membrane associated rhomboid family serine protease